MSNEQVLENFQKIIEGVDVQPFLAELQGDEAWTKYSERQKFIKVQRETQSVFLRAPVVSLVPPPVRKWLGIDLNNSQSTFWTPQAKSMPDCRKFLQDFADSQGAKLARATLVRLQPQGKVYPHIDEGTYYKRRNRYHLVLQSPSGSILTSGDETVVMKAGELWWFDNKKVHSAENIAAEWRIHLIFDMEPLTR